MRIHGLYLLDLISRAYLPGVGQEADPRVDHLTCSRKKFFEQHMEQAIRHHMAMLPIDIEFDVANVAATLAPMGEFCIWYASSIARRVDGKPASKAHVAYAKKDIFLERNGKLDFDFIATPEQVERVRGSQADIIVYAIRIETKVEADIVTAA